ncbi:MAG: DNA-binding response regulator [Flammeovirgaceae bacterium]|nr:DNA-binding response regulator [Flammeovirgaceae bacterium]MBE60956.1 DNA-binding response regulator [Flammeovirgaceae bacterium]HCX23814.1 DNA-binding response regulator [Cytophagales bacterium]|tara:strand:+ start:2468 stop:3109 length:642 start_codon:yes stop_codon:yes gene_type:complete
MIKIALAEDNSFLATSIINKLGLFDDLKVKIQANNGAHLLGQLELDSNVDVILMDIDMPVLDGIAATSEISAKYPHIKTIMLTVMDNDQTIYSAIKAGAVGYLLKETAPDALHQGILTAMNGGSSMSPTIARKALNLIQNPQSIEEEQEDFGLSTREIDILKQICKGLSYSEIASNLIISPNTVRRHTENIYKKLDVNSKSQAVLLAYKHRLV